MDERAALLRAARTLAALDVLLSDCRCGGWCPHMAAARALVRERVAELGLLPAVLLEPRALPAGDGR